MYVARNIKGGTEAVTVTLAATASYLEVYATEYRGADTGSPVDASAQASGSSASVSSGNAITTSANDVLTAFCVGDNSCRVGSGFTARSTFNSNLVEDRAAGAAGSYAATATASSGWAIIMAALRPAGAGAPVPVATVTVAPNPASVVVGGTVPLTATTKDAGGNVLTGRVITWASSNTALATVNGSGAVTGVAAGGPVTITATSEGQSGTSAVTVTAVPVASVTVAPNPASVVVGGTVALTATTKDAGGNVLTGRVITWASSNTALATVNASGVVTGVAAGGPVTITATSEGQSGTSAVTVTAVPVASVTVTPNPASVVVGATVPLTATTKDAGGNVLTGRVITWASSNTALATVSTSGVVTGVAAGGPVTITATSEGQSGTSAVTVSAVSVASVVVSPSTASVSVGYTVPLTATTKDASGNVLTGRTVTWTTSNAAIATVSATGLVTGVAAGGPVTVTATSEGQSGTAAVTVVSATALGLLQVSSVNPRYFTDGTGRAVYLTGSHYWTNLQDAGLTSPPPVFNWTNYLNYLVQHHHNFTRMWAWENVKWQTDTKLPYYYDPLPFARVGPDTAPDGLPKYDLTQFNQAYFDRLRQRVIDAGQRGIYVQIMLFDGWSIEDKGEGLGNPWNGHPMNRAWNVNGIDGDPNNTGFGLLTQTLQIPAITAIQEAYVRKVIDAVNDQNNVLYEISNESRGGSAEVAWEYHMIQVIRQYEAGLAKQHPVGMTALYPNGNDADLFASAADFISPAGTVGTSDVPAATGAKVLLYDTDHLCGLCGDETWVWKALTRGVNPTFMDQYDGSYVVQGGNPNDPRWEPLRLNLGYALTYANRMNLVAMTPHGELASTGYCLANPVAQGGEWLVYLPSGGSVTVNLAAAVGSLTVEWFSPSTGQTTAGGSTTGGASRTFTAPGGGDAVLYIH
ncbi:MAG TPA: Ig-like domain-containing protein [Gemmatimonadales bacterium]|nr:Ig-like domain-containing protein [Gemmatimonadales bacterium]